MALSLEWRDNALRRVICQVYNSRAGANQEVNERGGLRRRLDWYNELYASETDEARRDAYRYQIANLEERLTELDRGAPRVRGPDADSQAPTTENGRHARERWSDGIAKANLHEADNG